MTDEEPQLELEGEDKERKTPNKPTLEDVERAIVQCVLTGILTYGNPDRSLDD